VSAHFAEVYGASVWRDTVSRDHEKVPAEMNDWDEPALERVYPVIFLDTGRGQGPRRAGHQQGRSTWSSPVTTGGERDILPELGRRRW
jgi:transposase-like protein